MKRIIAQVKPNMLEDVVFALHKLPGFRGALISEAKWIEAALQTESGAAQAKPAFGFPAAVRLETVCADQDAEALVDTIARNARTGLPDDGAICVANLESYTPISTWESQG